MRLEGACLIGRLLLVSIWIAAPLAAAPDPARPPSEPASAQRVVGYFTQWSIYRRGYPVKSIHTTGSAERLTHVNYAFAKIGDDLKCASGDPYADHEKVFDAGESVDGIADPSSGVALRGNFRQLEKLKGPAFYPHLKVLISIGGWTWSDKFSDAALPENRAAFAASCVEMFLKGNFAPGISAPGVFDGIDIDWEYPAVCGNPENCKFRPEDTQNFTALLEELRAQMDALGAVTGKQYLLTIAAPAGPDRLERLELDKIHRPLDFVNLMTYDFHTADEPSTSFHSALYGAPEDPQHSKRYWTDHAVQAFLAAGVPSEKLGLGMAFYGRGWRGVEPGPRGEGLYQPGAGPARGRYEPGVNDYRELVRLEGSFQKHRHPQTRAAWIYDGQDWWTYDDPAAILEKMRYVRAKRLGGVMFWELGGDTPAIDLLSAISCGLRPAGACQQGPGALPARPEPQLLLEGDGELLQLRLRPASFTVVRSGFRPRTVVLTFEDGPDPLYTPKILDTLKRTGTPAAFFVVGRAAHAHPELLARIWTEGHEIGNHTFTHVRLAGKSELRARLEIAATQRLIESVTGHTTMLFRPPDLLSLDPRSSSELSPILQAARWRFISVGALNDPGAWTPPGRAPDAQLDELRVRHIVESIWSSRDAGSIIRLHDGLGERSATVAALPEIIERFRGAGYRFGTISELSGIPREVLLPPVAEKDRLRVSVAGLVFDAARLAGKVLVFLFVLAIVLGILRQVLVASLALIQRRKERACIEPPAGGAEPLVTVVIAAYNEEKVIERTVRSILASDYPSLEIIVVDDGSRDGTYEVVTCAFASEPRVRCERKENAGKASALNLGLALARGEILVGLDADTLFARDTISRMVRHFADPRVGAVAGNVRVGNPNNVLTRWQALEYITSQNFDRRAYALLNCITVVPGAVGAWRIEAVLGAGGYTHDTLAEDTDLTWRIRRLGWCIRNEITAMAYTEAPETLHNLARQRYRWSFGTLQNLWKHRGALFRYGAFGWLALPSLWIFQILFQAIAPIVDAAVVWSLFTGGFSQVALYYGLMAAAELVGAALALWMDRSASWHLLPWLFVQRLCYRQLMYYVMLKSLFSAVLGSAVGWNKLDRRGTAQLGASRAVAPACAGPIGA
jgi:GH18 family chitinase/cellulose synthase/poly-beta-1,6-N-acetylglucosamine synthase-like glycosyltransferase/peptidoglycan/xylan/chitin deacetylase (PgdA/CDA1 family)